MNTPIQERPSDISKNVWNALIYGSRVNAVKIYRVETGATLRSAIDFVEKIVETHFPTYISCLERNH